MSSLAGFAAPPSYDRTFIAQLIQAAQRELDAGYRKDGNIVIPYGFSISLTGTGGHVATLGLNGSNQFTISIDGATAFALGTDDAILSLTSAYMAADASLSASITSEASTRATADTAISTTVTTLTATVATNASTAAAAVSTEATARATADSAETSARTSADSAFTTSLATTNANLTTEQTTRATADTAETNARTSADSTLTTNLATTNANLTTEQTTRANADTAETSARTSADSTLTTNLATTNANLTSEASTRASADSSEASTRSSADATLTTNLATANANITTNTSSIATNTASISTLNTTVSANYTSASIGSAINASPTFVDNANASGVPTNWTDWSYGSTGSRITGLSPQPYAFRMPHASGQDSGVFQYLFGKVSTGWHVIEADITLQSGSLSSAGIHCNWDGGSVSLVFATDKDINGSVIGAGSAGTLYKFRKLVQVTKGSTYNNIYAMSSWSGFASTTGASSIDWHRCALRPASIAEINGNQASIDLVTTNANVSTNTSAIATVDGKLSASYGLTVDAGGRIASMKLLSNGTTSSVKFTASTFQVYNGTTDEAPFIVEAGEVRVAKLAANSVTASKLSVVGQSAVRDGMFGSDDTWMSYNDSTGVSLAVTASPPSGSAWWREGPQSDIKSQSHAVYWSGRSGTNFSQQHSIRPLAFAQLPVIAGRVYESSYRSYNLVSNAFTPYWEFFDYLGTYISTISGGSDTAGGGLQTIRAQITAPSNAATVRVNAQVPAGTTGLLRVTDLQLREANAASMVVDGSITATKLSVSSLDAITATIGLLRTATSGARTEIESNQIRVYDSGGTLRVRMGVW